MPDSKQGDEAKPNTLNNEALPSQAEAYGTHHPCLPETEGLPRMTDFQSWITQDDLSPFLDPSETKRFLSGKRDQPRIKDLRAEREEGNALKIWQGPHPVMKPGVPRSCPDTDLASSTSQDELAGGGSGAPAVPPGCG